ncbi:MAG: MMPL family transporter [Bacteroidales bacterium]|nr:MMPL family transporter [Bacteroidales bacterium]
MERLFLPVYSFFKTHRLWMWVCLLVSTVAFAVCAVQLKYEEDLTKLLPKAGNAEESGLAFGQLSVKDKLFVEIVSKNGDADIFSLAQASDEFIDALLAKDTTSHYIGNVLYRIEDDWMINGIDYALMHFPSLIPEESYEGFELKLTKDEIMGAMERNVEKMNDDWDGTVTQVVTYDPAELRLSMLEQGQALTGGLGGYKMMEKHFFTPDSTAALAFIAPDFKSFDSKAGAALDDMVAEARDEFCAAHPEFEVLYHGATVLSAGNSRQIKKDLVVSLTLSIVIILLVLMLCFRNGSTLTNLLVPVLYGAMFSMACIFLIKGKMSLMALGLGAIVLGIAISYVLHVLTHFKYTEDPERVLVDQATPVCLSCITTIGALAGLLFTKSELLSDFGLFASFALIGTTFFTLVFLPHFFNAKKNRKNEKAFKFIENLNGVALDRKWALIAVIAVVCVASFFFAPKVGFDNNMKNIGYVAPEVQRSQDLYADKVNHGLASVYFAASAPTVDEALGYNEAITSTLDRLQKEGLVKQFSPVSSLLMTEMQQAENIDRWTSFWDEDRVARARKDIASAARINLLDPEIFDPFFALVQQEYYPESLVESGIVPEELACNFVEKVGDDYLVFTSTLIDESDKKQVSDAVTANPHAIVVDPFYYMSDMIEIIHGDFNVVLMISSLFVLVVLLVSYRRLSLAILAFLPMFLSWYIVQGIMAVTGLQFNLINIIVSSFVFGVGVDYSIFIMDGLLADARGGDKKLLSYHKTAIALSAFTLVVVVCTLLLSDHPALHSVGVCTLIGMVSTILLSYCIQPLLFRLIIKVPFFHKTIVGK